MKPWEKLDNSDYLKPLDITYTRKISNYWLFGFAETLRVVEYLGMDGHRHGVRYVTHFKFFWIRDHFYDTILGWEMEKIITRKYNNERSGSIEDFSDEFPFIGKYSKRIVRQNKLKDLLTKYHQK